MSEEESKETPAPKTKAGLPWRVRGYGALIVLMVCLSHLTGLPVLDRLEFHLYDLAFRVREPRPPSEKIALAVVDEHSLNVLGRWPWRRTVFADLVRALSKDGAKVIAFTMAFLEPDSLETMRFVDHLVETLDEFHVENSELRTTLARLEHEADTDGLLGEAIEASDASVVLGYFFHLEKGELPFELSKEELQARTGRLNKSAYPVLQFAGGAERPPFLRAFAPQASVERLARATPHAGFLQVPTDLDGGVRRSLLAIEYGGKVYPSLGVQVVWNYLDRPALAVVGSEFGMEGVGLGRDRFIETDASGRVLIDYPGPPGNYPVHSISDVVQERFPEGTFRDKIVLIGSTAKGIGDAKRTPMAAFHPSIEMHASIVDNLLEGDSMVWTTTFLALDLLAILLTGGLGVLLLGRRGVLVELVGSLAVCGAYVFLAMKLLQTSGFYVNIVFPPLALVLVMGQITVSRYLQEEADRKQIEATFGRYVAPRVMEQMLENPDQLRLGGEERLITVLFSDLKGFTAASEALTPSQMIELMCEYFEEMTARIYEQDGLLKEYVGDEIMAIYGAPLIQEDHAVRACRAALAMRSRLRVLSVEWQEKGRPPVAARWGVNSGVMLVGNLGSSYRYAYGALGDNVNLGSRLEGLNNQYGTEILIGENTEELVRDHFHLREVDTVQVKGKSKGVRVFELLAPVETPLEKTRSELVAEYSRGLEAYRTQRWQEATAAFEKVLELDPEDGPAKVLRARIDYFADDPPGEDWNGVFEAKTK